MRFTCRRGDAAIVHQDVDRSRPPLAIFFTAAAQAS